MRGTTEKVTGDSGFFSGRALQAMKQRAVDLYVPDTIET